MPSDASKPIKLSFVVPILNEAESLETLVDSIKANIPAGSEDSYEIILVDDGSADNSWEEIIRIQDVYENRIQGLRFRRNFGKAAALQAGFDISKGISYLPSMPIFKTIPRRYLISFKSSRKDTILSQAGSKVGGTPPLRPFPQSCSISSPGRSVAFPCTTSIAGSKPIGYRR